MTDRRRFIAEAGEIAAVATAIEDLANLEEIGPLTLKGLLRPVAAFNVAGLRGTL